MKKIVLATQNEGKRKELDTLLSGMVDVHSLSNFPDCPDVEETGETFTENARLKAEFVAKYTGLPTLADDSGLVVDALDGAPGVYSARFAGEDKNDENNNHKLMRLLEGKTEQERTARFVCSLVYVDPDGVSIDVLGTCEGRIAHEPKGTNGFGYDPLMYIPHMQRTMAELSSAEKNSISHRNDALKKMKTEWEKRGLLSKGGPK
ncbi:XTP/dITP diphosphohydrolase [Geomicrobium halophilum]|uniref:dITP/XTP pyrophosphatase n=1 Tax=Geomicrobium halophilum TaxID=549000 RepID=A0A841PVR8_9BACL|nr:XTP/dITP diphosphatase [Geomicrobium halophilum]MBB6448313.1 XTP/dITP diphosphohydrolase [Geomicrobium halophilum]